MEIKNATTVHRIWKELPEAELMGAFQYETDARIYCRAAIESQPEGTFLALIDHYSGKMFCFHKAKADAEAQS